MAYARRTGQSHYTQYNNYYKAIESLKNYFKKTGYFEVIIKYVKGQYELPETEEKLGLPKDKAESA